MPKGSIASQTLIAFSGSVHEFSLNLISLQQKFSLPSNYLGTNTVCCKEG